MPNSSFLSKIIYYLIHMRKKRNSFRISGHTGILEIRASCNTGILEIRTIKINHENILEK